MNKKIKPSFTEEEIEEMYNARIPLIFNVEQPEPCIDRKPHQFEPRYSFGSPALSIPGPLTITADDFAKMVNSSKPQTYIHDLCIKCGKIIKPEAKNE